MPCTAYEDTAEASAPNLVCRPTHPGGVNPNTYACTRGATDNAFMHRKRVG